tara:strand:+ start:474 stop:620 length:147 start_codon:yes stop_codon:yes gene_type:complete
MSSDGKLCIGCGRTVMEITNWIYFSDKEKEDVLKKIYNKSSFKKSSSK